MAIFHVLLKRYYDGSGFYVCGGTSRDDVAQAFVAGGCDASAIAESYEVNTEASVCVFPDSIKAKVWE